MLEEVTSDIKSMGASLKKGLGKNGFALLLAGGAVVALIIILRSNSEDESDDYTVATGVASYPDAGENADVIISSIGSSIDYAQDEIIDSIGETIKDSAEDIKDNIKNPMYGDITTGDGGNSYQTPQEVISDKTDIWSTGEVLDIFKDPREDFMQDLSTKMNEAGKGVSGRSTSHSDFTTSTSTSTISSNLFNTITSSTGGSMLTGRSGRSNDHSTGGGALTKTSDLATGTMKGIKDKSNVNPTTGKKTASKTTPKTSKSTGDRSKSFGSSSTNVKSLGSSSKSTSGRSTSSSKSSISSKSSSSKSSSSKSNSSKKKK